jgi:hypothetical protein
MNNCTQFLKHTITILFCLLFITYSQAQNYKVTTISSTAVGGTTSGGGTYNLAQPIFLKAKPNQGYLFLGWKLGIGTDTLRFGSEDSTLQFAVIADMTAIAIFRKYVTFEVEAKPEIGGYANGVIYGKTILKEGDKADLSIISREGWYFKNWTENGLLFTNKADTSVIVDKNRHFVANFERIRDTINHRINFPRGGSISGGGVHFYGDTFKLKYNVNPDWRFVGWRVDDSSNLMYRFTVPREFWGEVRRNHTITAMFAENAPPSIDSHNYGGSYDDVGFKIVATDDGGWIMVGYATTFDAQDGDVAKASTTMVRNENGWIVKCDAKGIIQWQHVLGGSKRDMFTDIKKTKDGGYTAYGTTESNDGTVRELGNGEEQIMSWLVKLNTNGQIQWQKGLQNSVYVNPYNTIQTMPNGDILLGLYISDDTINIQTLNPSGVIVSQKRHKITNFSSANSRGFVATNDGSVFLLQTYNKDIFNSAVASLSLTLTKLNAQSDILWQKEFEQIGSLKKVIVDKEGGLYLVGTHISRIDADGKLLWKRKWQGHGAYLLSDGSLAVLFNKSAFTVLSNYYDFERGTTYEKYDVALLHFQKDGELRQMQWLNHQILDPTFNFYDGDLTQLTDGTFALIGTKFVNKGNNGDKLDISVTRQMGLFSRDKQYYVRPTIIHKDLGIISKPAMVDSGSIYKFKAEAKPGHTFLYWTENGRFVSNRPSFSLKIRKNTVLLANFIRQSPEIAVNANDIQHTTKSFTLFPNPTNQDIVYINFDTDKNTSYQLDVLDIYGREIISQKGQTEYDGIQEIPLSIGGLKSGNFIIRLVTNKGVLTQVMSRL